MPVPYRYTHPGAFAALEDETYLKLTTFRKNGKAVDTPVWFAEREGTLYVETGAHLGKVKRIRHTPRVLIAPCTVNGKVKGAALEAKARIVNDTEEIYIARGALHRKYGFQRQAYYFFLNAVALLRFKGASSHAYIAIEPLYIA